MSIRFFEDGLSDDDIPLLKDYLRLSPNLQDVHVVRKFVETAKGILVVTDAFKGTIWMNQDCYQELLEAVQILPELTENIPVFVVQALKTGKIKIGVDEASESLVTWVKDSEITTTAKQKNPKPEEVVKRNRFLTPSQKPFLESKVPPTSSSKKVPLEQPPK